MKVCFSQYNSRTCTNTMQLHTMVVGILATLLPLAWGITLPRSGNKLTQAQAEAQLSAAGITYTSSGGCNNKAKSSCTSYNGLLTGTVDGAITLKKACACSVVITGGTETGHASGTYSHGNGYKLDFRKNNKLDAYIKNSFTKISNRGDGYPRWKSNAGNIYCVSVYLSASLFSLFSSFLSVLFFQKKNKNKNKRIQLTLL
jgi:hypothetical protein